MLRFSAKEVNKTLVESEVEETPGVVKLPVETNLPVEANSVFSQNVKAKEAGAE